MNKIETQKLNYAAPLNLKQKVYSSIFVLGLLLLIIGSLGAAKHNGLYLYASFGFMTFGAMAYNIHTQFLQPPGIKNNHIWFRSISNSGLLGWMSGILLTSFYVIYYWWPHLFEGLYRMMDPISYWVRGEKTQSWFAYGTLYTFAVLVMGTRAIIKYRHSRYQIIRTSVVIFSQTILAWLIPGLLVLFKQPEKYLNYSWPLSFKDFWPQNFLSLWQDGAPKLAAVLSIYGLTFTFILTPILTYYFGKRWYC